MITHQGNAAYSASLVFRIGFISIVLFCLCRPSFGGPLQSENKTIKDLTSNQYQQTYMRQKELGFRPFDGKVRVKNDVAYFDIQFEKANSVGGFVAKHGIDDARFEELTADLKNKNYVLTCHQTYVIKKRRFHLAYWNRKPGKKLGTIWKADAKIPASGKTGARFKALDDLFVGYLKKHQLPGATVAVSYRGKVIYNRGFGYADVDTQEKMTSRSKMRIASVSKPITAAAIMKLADEGKLKLSTPVFEFLEFSPMDPKTVDQRLKEITIQHLLHHTAGFDRGQSYDPMFKPYEMSKALNKSLPIDTKDIIRYMMSQPLDFDPGERMAYSNFGYCLLGRVIEKVSDRTYEEYVQAEILKPVKARGMEIGTSLEQDRAKNEVKYFLREQTYFSAVVAPEVGSLVKRQYGVTNVPIMDSHGAWISSAADLVRFAMAFDDPKRCRLMSESAVNEMFAAPDYLDLKPDSKGRQRYYANGWNVVRGSFGFNSYHGGALAGTSTLLVRRSDGYSWAILFNCRKTPDGKEATSEIDSLMHRAVDAASKSRSRK